MYNFIGYEHLFSEFIKTVQNEKIIDLNPIGLDGYVSVTGEYYSG
jgi:S-ribosylhomocysteine lyase LuxS involved in autoinducer biosynthesis